MQLIFLNSLYSAIWLKVKRRNGGVLDKSLCWINSLYICEKEDGRRKKEQCWKIPKFCQTANGKVFMVFSHMEYSQFTARASLQAPTPEAPLPSEGAEGSPPLSPPQGVVITAAVSWLLTAPISGARRQSTAPAASAVPPHMECAGVPALVPILGKINPRVLPASSTCMSFPRPKKGLWNSKIQ